MDRQDPGYDKYVKILPVGKATVGIWIATAKRWRHRLRWSKGSVENKA